ncbi:uncharacterized protein PRD47_010483 isoform 8-T8 [Ara ararauna]
MGPVFEKVPGPVNSIGLIKDSSVQGLKERNGSGKSKTLDLAGFLCLQPAGSNLFFVRSVLFLALSRLRCQGLQLKARARTWRMCRQTEGEPREEKPKWIHSLSWMEEERRGEGDVRASFSCLCPVESAQTPGAAPASGSARTFTPSCQSKLSLAATLLWHRHLSVTPVISVPNRRGPHFLLSTLPTTRSFHKAARGACLGEGQSVFVTRE